MLTKIKPSLVPIIVADKNIETQESIKKSKYRDSINLCKELQGLTLKNVSIKIFLVIFLSIGVFAGYSIWKEAYFGLHANANRYIRFLIVIIAINLIPGVKNWMNGSMFTDGKLNYTCINLGCAVLLIIMLVIISIKKNQKQEEE